MQLRNIILAAVCFSFTLALVVAPAMGCDGQKKADTQPSSDQASADSKDSK